MCSMYWRLYADVRCPHCGALNKKAEMQTHYMGVPGSCNASYGIGDPIPELAGITVTLNGENSSLGTYCDSCQEDLDMGAEIVDGKVIRVWPLAVGEPELSWID